jgi:hypothetical protein
MESEERKPQINVRVDRGDLEALQHAARLAWPQLRLTTGKILLTLAMWKAKEIVEERLKRQHLQHVKSGRKGT